MPRPVIIDIDVDLEPRARHIRRVLGIAGIAGLARHADANAIACVGAAAEAAERPVGMGLAHPAGIVANGAHQ
jgi:hypothetical protein